MNQEDQNKLLKIVKNNYREIAGSFDLTRKKHVWPEMEKLLIGLNLEDSVLDIGCGNGRLLEVIKNQNYLGVDNSEELISLAKQNYPDNNFRVADILDLKIENKYDLVISVAVLHHLPSEELRLKALAEMNKVAKGKIYFSVWRMWNNQKYQPLLIKNIWLKITGRNKLEIGDLLFPWKNHQGDLISQRYYHAFTKGELRRLLSKAGLNNYQIITEAHNYWVLIDTP
jgi:tRNA (uracil-5-)-methyltransferase TRM9